MKSPFEALYCRHTGGQPAEVGGPLGRLVADWHQNDDGGVMELGAFSVSLAVKDIEASRRFYETLGFSVFMGDQTQNWLIMKNGEHVIGLFQGMFEKNILTFNPGWNSDAQQLADFTDVRELQRHLKGLGLSLVSEADESSIGPASFMVVDPDGNTILVDQHV